MSTSPALAVDLPDQVLVKDSCADELSAGLPDLEQHRLRLRTDDCYLSQINDQLLDVWRAIGLLPGLLELCDPWLDELSFEDQPPLAPGLMGCDF
jgi:hypothetical protein